MAVRVPLPSSVPTKARVLIVSLPVKVRRAPLATVTVAASASRFVAPRVNTPELTTTLVAAAVPPSAELPVEVSVFAPRLAPSTVAPPVSA